ncbi:histone-lysine N-methyltransferase ATX2-like [Benincasa hispida]|uniref:histone-lysine N-methyltransferase ATX2-like n=1 Tax=Benincasa hispida TaxID=102211 RepID=UPI001900378D|nr:histone-lysine N-methyltransferase ATX2-like [Benincasa hispida]XP_038884708.1 histone-lysine N-methyltransferase ATX2-like [Benincasa hispida]
MALPLQQRPKPPIVDGEDGDDINIDVYNAGTPIRYLSLDHVYSTTSPFVSTSGSSNVMSKKVKARRLVVNHFDDLNFKPPRLLHVYSRRRKKPRHSSAGSSVYESLVEQVELGSRTVVESEAREIDEMVNGVDDHEEESEVDRTPKKKKKRKDKFGCNELVKLEVDSSVIRAMNGPRLRDCRTHSNNNKNPGQRKKRNSSQLSEKTMFKSPTAKRWVRLSFEDVDPKVYIGLQCKVYWPLDADWYCGCVVGYNSETGRHHIEYEDEDREDLILSNEKVKFHISGEEMQSLNLNFGVDSVDSDAYDYNEMLVLAASLDDCLEPEPGDIVWAKLTGHAMWPAIIVDESLIGDRKGLRNISGGRTVPVQFFGTHDFARIKVKQAISFLKGLLSFFHQKCKKPHFMRSLEEAKMYLSEQKLPPSMLQLQNGIEVDDFATASGEEEGTTDSGEECLNEGGGMHCLLNEYGSSPFIVGDLEIISLGKIVKDSKYFQNDGSVWPEGYTAVRKFSSLTDPNVCTLYRMEVLRDFESKFRPLFRVTLDNGEQFKGSSPSACWNKIYKRMRKVQHISDAAAESKGEFVYKSGSDMFGFSNPDVKKLIQGISKSGLSSSRSSGKVASKKYKDFPIGYRPVRVDWKDLDKCSVCHMDEEYENNLFLQCDKCRMMVHARCYGELEPVDGVIWLCNLCRPGSPDCPPPCCLCPVIGGAMKPTTDGRWAHLACAIWIPETCLSDIKKMEPIDGLNRINKDRWKLLCSICGVSYGACIQCSNNTCYVAYHPLCARAAGLCVELEEDDRLHLLAADEDEEHQCIRLLSFCKKHRPPSNERLMAEDRIGQAGQQCSNYTPPCNPSGCARTEPYNYFGRRGRKAPEAVAAASLKRLFVENQPYIASGYSQHLLSGNLLPCIGVLGMKFSLQHLKTCQLDPRNILSVAEKYKFMRETFRKRLAFGKSGIHGFGIFAKHPHRAGDMVIEYTGEIVRPPIADRRERFIYNLLVGAGTYMFRIDDERVIDATRAGSIAHLINHSCEPNCYSRVISVNGDEHIIIFAKRDIKRWEELTYDYRFFSIDEQLACYCGYPRCRGVVNDMDEEERVSKLHVSRTDLVDWKGE